MNADLQEQAKLQEKLDNKRRGAVAYRAYDEEEFGPDGSTRLVTGWAWHVRSAVVTAGVCSRAPARPPGVALAVGASPEPKAKSILSQYDDKPEDSVRGRACVQQGRRRKTLTPGARAVWCGRSAPGHVSLVVCDWG